MSNSRNSSTTFGAHMCKLDTSQMVARYALFIFTPSRTCKHRPLPGPL
jgi:hypothetical protein